MDQPRAGAASPDPASADPAGAGTPVGVARRAETDSASVRAARTWWDAQADAYHAEHGEFLGVAEFVWCPEDLREADAQLLGELDGRRVLEIGCGSAMCSRWVARHGGLAVAADLSAGMLRHAVAGNRACGVDVPLVQADAQRLPFRDAFADIVFTAFGAIQFVADSAAVMAEAARVLRPGGRFVFATTHPVRWSFPDDPGPEGLRATMPYWDRTPYVEFAEDSTATYVEHHRTLGDRVREITAAGLQLIEVIEPEWPAGHTREWGQWSPLRGAILPGTAIYVCRKPG